MILTLAGLAVKIIGSVNRILLSRLLGGEGIGLYQMAYPVYLLLVAVSSAGIAIAVSIMISEKLAQKDYGNVQRIFKVSISLMVLVGTFFSGGLFGVAGWMVDQGIVSDARAYYGLVALTPAVLFSAVLACFRGYFQGLQLMTAPAVSQILEQLVRVVTMLVLAYLLLPRGLAYAAAGAAFGAVPGGIMGIVVLAAFYCYYQGRQPLPKSFKAAPLSVGAIGKRLLLLALPVACANVVVPLTSSVDMLLVPRRLIASGYSIPQATELFGYLAGMAQPLLLLATIPTVSLAASIVPAIAAAHTLGHQEEIREKALMALKLCSLITLPAAAGMMVLAEPISLLLYGTGAAARALLHSGPALWLLGLQQISTGILQGMGKIHLPMVHMLLGLGVKIFAVWFLTNATWNIAGAAWATNINFGLAATLNLWVLYRCQIRFPWLQLGRMLVATAGMALVAYYSRDLLQLALSPSLATLAAIFLAALVYLVLVPLLGVVDKKEMSRLPLVKRLWRERKKA